MSARPLALTALHALPRNELMEQWVELYRSAPPQAASRKLIERAVAYALQANRYGGLSTKPRRQLQQLTRTGSVAPSSARYALTPGARLVRTWNGITHVIDVVDGGYLWNGARHRSLSAIALAITGARWSGPRFFGIVR